MSENIVSQITTEVERIVDLPLGEQMKEFIALHDELASTLNDLDSNR